jgi:tRNA uridine 5-carbamoylmethylation protein Kti12
MVYICIIVKTGDKFIQTPKIGFMQTSVSVPNPQLELAFDFVQYTHCNVFLTGKAGTGKTTFLRRLREVSLKRMVVVAPTGVAAINAGGVTIHSMFQMPFGPIVPQQANSAGSGSLPNQRRFNKEKIDIIKSIDLLVIDEISMVRADLLDGIDAVLRQYRNRNKPFGGVQLLMIGDLQQLAPVVKDDEWQLLKPWFETPYFFSSKALQQSELVTVELKHIYRQSDPRFINILNKVRENKLDEEVIRELNQRYIPGFAEKAGDGYIILTTHNNQARQINDRKLLALTGRNQVFHAEKEGEFPEYAYPTETELHLKLGAQVMFVKNDTSRQKLFFNGKIGVVEKIIEEVIFVRCEGDDALIPVEKAEWQNMKYAIDETTKEINEQVIGKFTQYPLKLAWAITIHKSQGLTFEKAIIDAGASFAHGQVYVALSRCKTLEGMVLSSPIGAQSLKSDQTVKSFTTKVEANQPTGQQLKTLKSQYQQSLLFEMFDLGLMRYRIGYCQKVVDENSTVLHGNLSLLITQLQQVVVNELTPVADKFKVQMQHFVGVEPDIDSNNALHERVKSASAWFASQMREKVSGVLAQAVLVTDNKAVRKTMGDALLRLKEEVNIRQSCFDACVNGFELSAYLAARAKASIEKAEMKISAAVANDEKEAESLTIEHPELYNRLKKWRNQEAAKNNHPVYLVISTATMVELSNQLPVYLPDLKKIKGLGAKKYAQYGMELIQMVLDYRKEKGMSVPSTIESMTDIADEDKHISKKKEKKETREPKEPKVPTRVVSFNMYKEGKSIAEIAAVRGLTNGTIESHLIPFVEEGVIDAGEFVSSDKIVTVAECSARIGSTSSTDIKNELGDAFSYSDIRFALAHLHRNK